MDTGCVLSATEIAFGWLLARTCQ